jgi:NADH-quinone oxidoreductase subunit H
LFLGGWSINPLSPFISGDLPMAGGWGMILLQCGVVFGKVFGLILLIMVLRWSLPRFRYDQLMRLAWEGMIPTALLVLLVTSLWVFLGLSDDGLMWLAGWGLIPVIWLVRPLVARRVPPNARIPLAGSRFSPLAEEEA